MFFLGFFKLRKKKHFSFIFPHFHFFVFSMNATFNPFLRSNSHIIDFIDGTGWRNYYILACIFILLQVMFPFYVYVNRVNRERDKNYSSSCLRILFTVARCC
ncbi:Protein CBG18661 [Caenorhabditis briggsae]|uniref:Protein CBG18661 n=1 Tax=Caenorhabditis briggsae TaxID=6238 RepID=A8XTU5_CAEBR|nr:Protein CBG18661 [Caenorhabditis briggsae]CAP36071.2 Protein CBG18661 [Caenorhabditis briggsae]